MTVFDLHGDVALVTGAGRGIGAAIAVLLAERGAEVVVNDIDEGRASSVAAGITEQGGRAVAAPGDVTARGDVDALLARARAHFGEVSILVNNAGVPSSGLARGPFVDSDVAQWASQIALNAYGPMHCAQAALPPMLLRRYGRIITIVSDAGRVGEPQLGPYAASKAAAGGFTRALAKEVGSEGVTCNCVALGWVEEHQDEASAALWARAKARYAIKRPGRPVDVAAAVLWLASREAGWVTGQTISVNGGYSMS